ncbi:MAG: site-2 protease family protein [Rhabdochlamydiaceae bacterium]
MLFSFLHVFLAILGLSFLVFIHEFGHYYMALRVGMKVEAFSVGFGKPIYSFQRNGVSWRICWIPFGGYVKIKGMEKSESSSQEEGDFYTKKPLDRIKVAFAGPFVNFLFSLCIFSVLWFSGGRLKNFAEHTKLIGWIDPSSELYQNGVRPGDEVSSYGGVTVNGYVDILTQSAMNHDQIEIKGLKKDYFLQLNTPYTYTLPVYQASAFYRHHLSTVGIMSPASYLLYRQSVTPQESPIMSSEIVEGDRIIWMDGEMVFSQPQLSSIVNRNQVFLTIRREGQVLQLPIKRVTISDLRLTNEQKGEFDDWQNEIGLNKKLNHLYFIPFSLSPYAVVESTIPLLTEIASDSNFTNTLQKGDQILAVDGTQISTAFEFLKHIQDRKVQIIVQRGNSWDPIDWQEADERFFEDINWKDLQKMINSIGSERLIISSGDLHLLQPVKPIQLNQFPSEAVQKQLSVLLAKEKEKIEKLDKPDEKLKALSSLEASQKKLILGFQAVDRQVKYNPSPFVLIKHTFKQTIRTLKDLVLGNLHPKWMQGPVGIVQVMHHGWNLGIKEACFWLAMISLNLGIFNLIPLPVLDGGHIGFSLWEQVTKKPVSARAMEKVIIPFIVIFILFFLYVTYNDIGRLFHSLIK